jgi:hypothetical protein
MSHIYCKPHNEMQSLKKAEVYYYSLTKASGFLACEGTEVCG